MLDPDSRDLDAVMILWAIAGVVAAAIGIWKFKQLKTSGWHLPIDWAWIKKGIAVSSVFLIATLALRGFQTLDRYWLEALSGIETVGAYVLFMGVAGTLIVFLDAALFSFSYPVLIALNHKEQHSQAHKKIKQLFAQTCVICAVFGALSWSGLPYFIEWIGNPVYMQAVPWYPWMLSAMVLNAIGLVPHYGLYARGQDKPIIYSHIASMLMFATCTWALNQRFGPLAVPMGVNAAFLLILIWKIHAYVTLIHQKP